MLMAFAQRSLDLARPQIMGILNATPDSFSDGGRFYAGNSVDIDLALRHAEQMVSEGATIIDVGGESTRPGAQAIAAEVELERIQKIVEAIGQRIDVIVSVDTSSPLVIKTVAGLGAGCINDVRALRLPGALTAAAQANLPVCLMHMQGEPASMQHDPSYVDVVSEVKAFFEQQLLRCAAAGIPSDKIILDPGIGFGKTDAHNLALLNQLNEFSGLGCPLLVGLSRKSMVGRLLGRDITHRLAGSLGFGLIALQRGAKILRVHDVAATADILRVFELTN